jgi:hypothetical protein
VTHDTPTFETITRSPRSADQSRNHSAGRRYGFDGTPLARFSFAWLNERESPETVERMAAARSKHRSDETS